MTSFPLGLPIATGNTRSSSAGPAANAATDFQTFLRMLTVQMQNQDPLNPIDSTDYAVQLATFSGVEQQVRTNQLLGELQGMLQQSGIAEMAGWIGKEVRSDAPVNYAGSPILLSPRPASGATEAVLVVHDAQGRLVAREALPVDDAPYHWLGGGADGSPLPPGMYRLSLESIVDGTVVQNAPVEHYARVTEARAGSDGVTLILAGGAEVAANRVTAVRSVDA